MHKTGIRGIKIRAKNGDWDDGDWEESWNLVLFWALDLVYIKGNNWIRWSSGSFWSLTSSHSDCAETWPFCLSPHLTSLSRAPPPNHPPSISSVCWVNSTRPLESKLITLNLVHPGRDRDSFGWSRYISHIGWCCCYQQVFCLHHHQRAYKVSDSLTESHITLCQNKEPTLQQRR